MINDMQPFIVDGPEGGGGGTSAGGDIWADPETAASAVALYEGSAMWLRMLANRFDPMNNQPLPGQGEEPNYVLIHLLTTENVRKLIACAVAERGIPAELNAEWKSLDLVTLLLDRSRVQPLNATWDRLSKSGNLEVDVAVQVRVIAEIKPCLGSLLRPVLLPHDGQGDKFSRLQQLTSMRLCNQLFVALQPPPAQPKAVDKADVDSAVHVSSEMRKYRVELGAELERLKLVPSLVVHLRRASSPASNLMLCHLQRTLLQVLNLKRLFASKVGDNNHDNSDDNSELLAVVNEAGRQCLLELVKLLPLLPSLSHDSRAVSVTLADIADKLMQKEVPAEATAAKGADLLELDEVADPKAAARISTNFEDEKAWLEATAGAETWKQWEDFIVSRHIACSLHSFAYELPSSTHPLPSLTLLHTPLLCLLTLPFSPSGWYRPSGDGKAKRDGVGEPY
jgi:hypothetical protein